MTYNHIKMRMEIIYQMCFHNFVTVGLSQNTQEITHQDIRSLFQVK